jgi:two-component system nitrate/nitrite response regulator NarL
MVMKGRNPLFIPGLVLGRMRGWMPSKVIGQQRALRIPGEKGAEFNIFIVGPDSLSSGTLADALIHDIGCDAVAIEPGDLLRSLSTSKSALVIINADLSSGPGSGFDLATRVSGAFPAVHIVILLERPVREAVIRAFRSGARGVFSRQQSIREFIDCVVHVNRGFMCAGREVSDVFLKAFRSSPTPLSLTGVELKTLTKRELQVVQLAATGKTNKAIASEVCLSEHTVKNYLFRAFEKLGVTSRVELLFHLTELPPFSAR